MATVARAPSHQIVAVRLLADSLYEATRGSTALTNQAQNELGLLLAVLGATEIYAASLGSDCTHIPVLKKRLHSCYEVLTDLQKLNLHPDALGAQSQISDVRARFSSVVFALSELNTNMMISSQKQINRALSSLVDDARVGAIETSVIFNALNENSKIEADEAWLSLQHELVNVGISSELADQNRDSIISTLRNMVKTIGLSPSAGEQSVPVEKAAESTVPAAENDRRLSVDENDLLSDEISGLPFLPLPPIGFSHSNSYSNQDLVNSQGLLPDEQFPIPVTTDQGPTDTLKQPLQPLIDLPMSVTEENLASDKQTPGTSHSIPVIVTSTKPKLELELDPCSLKVATRTKKSNRLSRLRWQITSSKEMFIMHIKQGQLEHVQLLLTKGADVNAQNDQHQTALMVAVSFGHEHITRLLLEYGAEINAHCNEGHTALTTAALRGFERIVRMLVASGAEVNGGIDRGKVALSQAAAYGQDRIVSFLLDSGANIDAFGKFGETALGLAALNDNRKVARLLLDRGAGVNHMRVHWQLPLYKAVKNNAVEMARLLMQRGADPLIKDSRKEDILDYARKMHRMGILGVFADHMYAVGNTAVPYQYF